MDNILPAARWDRKFAVLSVCRTDASYARLPVVLTVDEVSRVMAHLSGDKWLIAMPLYGGGLRLKAPSESL